MIHRQATPEDQKNDPTTQAATFQGSYSAKTRGKEDKPKGKQLVTATRLPKEK